MLKPKIKPLLQIWLSRLRAAILRVNQFIVQSPKFIAVKKSVSRYALRTLRYGLLLVALTGVFLYTRVGVPARVEAATPATLNFQARLLNGIYPELAPSIFNVFYCYSSRTRLSLKTYSLA